MYFLVHCYRLFCLLVEDRADFRAVVTPRARRVSSQKRSSALEELEARTLPAITIAIDYTQDSEGFFNEQDRRDALQAAADMIAFALRDDLAAIIPSGQNNWTAFFSHPGNGGDSSISNLVVPADTLILFVGGMQLSGPIAQGGPGGYSASGDATWLDAVSTRGEVGAAGSENSQTDVGFWGGSITFSTSVMWHAGLDTPVAESQDLYSVALHEIGHCLGIGTSNPWFNHVSDSFFMGANSIAEYGENIPLSGTGHWASGTESNVPVTGAPQTAVMVPSITAGERRDMTLLDWAGLKDLGWEVDLSNEIPTLDVIADVSFDEDAAEQTVDLTGITAGLGETQPLRITAKSSNPSLLSDPVVIYTSANSIGSLQMAPSADQTGTVIVTVTVEDGGHDGNLSTAGDNSVFERSFSVTVLPVNDPPTLDAVSDIEVEDEGRADVGIELTGVTAGGGEMQLLQITAVSSDLGVVGVGGITYSSGDATGTLTLEVAPEAEGQATITVTVLDGGADNDLQTTADNGTFLRTFVVTMVSVRPVITGPVGSSEQQRPRLTWTPIAAAASYRIWVTQTSLGRRPLFKAVATEAYLDVPEDLGNGKIDVWVRGVRISGELLPWSRMHRFVVGTAPEVNDVADRQETARPLITWSAVPGATAYDVWVNNVSTGQQQFVRTTVTDPEWLPAAVLPLARYYIWVRAVTADGLESPWSVREGFYVASAPEVFSPVRPTFDRTPTFDFSDVEGATSYQVWVRYLVDGSIAANVTGLATSEWTPGTDLAPGRYAWWAIADSTVAGFRSAWTPRQEFYIGGLTSITSPVSPAASTTPLIEWLAVTDADHYVLWVNGDIEGAKLIYETNLTINSFQVVTPFVSGTNKYRVWVQAISTTGEAGPWSSTYVFTVASSDGDVDLDEQVAGFGVPELMLTQLAPRENSDETVAIPAKINLAQTEPDVREESHSDSEDQLQRLFEHAVEFDWFEELAELANI